MISFIVVTHNSRMHIGGCLEHIMAIPGMSCEIIVVDNDSRDDTRQIVRDRFESVRLIEMRENRGFAHGVNAGVRSAAGDVIFLLNPDASILSLDPRAALAGISSDRTGALGPKVLNPDDGGRQFSARRFPTLRTGVFNKSSIFTSLLPRNKYSMDYLNPIIDGDKRQAVDWVSGCAIVFRRDVFDALGGFDDDFFVFYEDIDFCYRLRKAGYDVIYDPAIVVSHEIGISRTVPTLKINYERHRGMWLYYKKHFHRKAHIDALVICGIILRFTITSIKVPIKRLVRWRQKAGLHREAIRASTHAFLGCRSDSHDSGIA